MYIYTKRFFNGKKNVKSLHIPLEKKVVMAAHNIQVRMRSSRTLMAWVWLMESAAWSGEPRLGM